MHWGSASHTPASHMSRQQSSKMKQSGSHWQNAPGSAPSAQRPTHDVPDRHCPETEQTSPGVSQLPQDPKQPSEPQARSVQSGVQVQMNC